MRVCTLCKNTPSLGERSCYDALLWWQLLATSCWECVLHTRRPPLWMLPQLLECGLQTPQHSVLSLGNNSHRMTQWRQETAKYKAGTFQFSTTESARKQPSFDFRMRKWCAWRLRTIVAQSGVDALAQAQADLESCAEGQKKPSSRKLRIPVL